MIAGLLRQAIKAASNGAALALAFLPAALSGFGRVSSVFSGFGQAFSLVPGLPGNYLRIAYYHLTLRECALNSRVSFGTFFSKSSCTIGPSVYIGAWCNFGDCRIGERTQIGDHVQILSGRKQHGRDAKGRILTADHKAFRPVSVGKDCWIGAAALVMEDIGDGTTVGAGAVVTKPVPENQTVVGNPAKPLPKRDELV